MTPDQVERILREFAGRARLAGRRADGSERWQFDVDARRYDLHYYPDDDTLVRRYVGGAAAAREFTQLQAMQKLHVPAARVVANLKGFRIGERRGDACILVHDLTATPLLDLAALPEFDRALRLRVTASLIALLEQLHRLKLCPVPLTLDAFAWRGEDEVAIVRDGGGRFEGIVTEPRLHELDAATRAITGVAERLRFWRHFTDARPPRRRDAAIRRQARRVARAADADGDERFGSLVYELPDGGAAWTGRFLRRANVALPWSRASRVAFAGSDWLAALPSMLEAAGWQTMKDDAAATVRSATVEVAGVALDVVAKRPAVKPGLRGAFDFFRVSRVRRTWAKTWRLLGLGFRCEVPMLALDRRVGPRLLEQLLVVERVPGPTLASIDLDALARADRAALLYDSGRVLREIERFGLTHRDAKATNWIVWPDPVAGRLRPVMIDLDGVRSGPWRGVGLARLIRAIRACPEATDADVESLERGYRG